MGRGKQMTRGGDSGRKTVKMMMEKDGGENGGRKMVVVMML